MEPKYETGSICLTKLIDVLGNNNKGTYLIPDFQRAYVWNPEQIINLLDTLFHGWPFGSILLAQAPQAGGFFYARPLYRSIKSQLRRENGKYKLDIQENESVCHNPAEPDTGYTLILDGQQRLQSLLFALSSTCTGITLREYDWLCLYKRQSYYPTKKYVCYAPNAKLYLNIDNLEKAMSTLKSSDEIQSLNYVFSERDGVKPIVEWCLDGDSPNWSWREYVPKNINSVKNTHIALSDLWDFTSHYIEKFSSSEKIVSRVFDENNVKALCKQKDVVYKPSLFVFCRYLSSLHALEIPFTRISLPIPEKTANEEIINLYNRSILTIFTRLNEGGIELSKSEITLSWIKRAWKDNNSENIYDCFSKNQKGGILFDLTAYDINLEVDDIINEIVFIWGICENKGKRLTQDDMMGGELLEKAAKWISLHWLIIKEAIIDTIDALYRNNIIFKKGFGSFRAVSYMAAWKIIGKQWFATLGGTLDKHARLNQCLQNNDVVAVHFVLAGQISNALYSDMIIRRLVELHDFLRNSTIDNGVSSLKTTLEDITTSLCEKANNVIREMTTTPKVSSYRNCLWIWHHLTEKRLDYSSCLMRDPDKKHEGKRLDVDHFIARDYWESEYLPRKGIEDNTPDYSKYHDAINQIGNCNIVEKNLNISMGKKAEQELHSFVTPQCNTGRGCG